MFMHGGLAHLGSNMLFLYIFGDNDASGAGQKAANELAVRWAAASRRAYVVLRNETGKDWNSP